MWGTPTLDWWASKKTAQLHRFGSLGGGDGSIGDARTVSIKGEFVWAVPPVTQVNYALQRMRQEQAKGLIVVPIWRSQAYYAWRPQMKAEWVCPWSKANPVIRYADKTCRPMNRYINLWPGWWTSRQAGELSGGRPHRRGLEDNL